LTLRILVAGTGANAGIDALRAALADPGLSLAVARPSLEDVFVACTDGHN
jgi:hypothetical protein